MKLVLKPGENPAVAPQIEIWAGEQKVSNIRVIDAESDPEKLTVTAIITQEKVSNEHIEQDQRNLHPESVSEQDATGKRTDSSSHKTSNSK